MLQNTCPASLAPARNFAELRAAASPACRIDKSAGERTQ